jgi:hypothetical protein
MGHCGMISAVSAVSRSSHCGATESLARGLAYTHGFTPPPTGWGKKPHHSRRNAMVVLPSVYRGITFRSRTEARWAVLFQELGLDWNYEPEGHGLSGRGYLPDFYLPQLGLYVEIKPDETDGSERGIFAELVKVTGKRGVIAYGPPSPGRRNLAYFPENPEEPEERFALLEDRRDDQIYWLGSDRNWFAIGGPGEETDHDRLPIVSDRLAAAFAKAAAERFGT